LTADSKTKVHAQQLTADSKTKVHAQQLTCKQKLTRNSRQVNKSSRAIADRCKQKISQNFGTFKKFRFMLLKIAISFALLGCIFSLSDYKWVENGTCNL
jgi:hypothetical protein